MQLASWFIQFGSFRYFNIHYVYSIKETVVNDIMLIT